MHEVDVEFELEGICVEKLGEGEARANHALLVEVVDQNQVVAELGLFRSFGKMLSVRC